MENLTQALQTSKDKVNMAKIFYTSRAETTDERRLVRLLPGTVDFINIEPVCVGFFTAQKENRFFPALLPDSF